MVAETPYSLNRVFHALSDPTRRDILARLAVQDENMTALASPYSMSLAAVSKHVKVLEEAGLVIKTKLGRIHRCSFNFTPLTEAAAMVRVLQQAWEGQLDSLEEYLHEDWDPNKVRRGRFWGQSWRQLRLC